MGGKIMTPNQKIKHLRRLADIPQGVLAQKLGIARPLLSQIEKEAVPTTDEFAQKAINIIKKMKPDLAQMLDDLKGAI
jgi:DNA-binding XRE family transcriptional regulator